MAVDETRNTLAAGAYASFIEQHDTLKYNDDLGPDVAPVYAGELQLEDAVESMRPNAFKYLQESAEALALVPPRHRDWAFDRARDANSVLSSLASLPGVRVMTPAYFLGKLRSESTYALARLGHDAEESRRLADNAGAETAAHSHILRDAQAKARVMAAATFKRELSLALAEGKSREEAARIAGQAARTVHKDELLARRVSTGFTAQEVGLLRLDVRARFDALPPNERAEFAAAVRRLLEDETFGLGRLHAYPLTTTDEQLRYEVRLVFEELGKMDASLANAV